MLLSISFHWMSWVINCSKKMVLGEHALPRAEKYCVCWSLTVVPADHPELLG
jgi:hypothetical protein